MILVSNSIPYGVFIVTVQNSQRVLSTKMVECRVSKLGFSIVIRLSLSHHSTYRTLWDYTPGPYSGFSLKA